MRNANCDASALEVRSDYRLHMIVATALRRKTEAQEFMSGVLCYRRRIAKPEDNYSVSVHNGTRGDVKGGGIENRFGISQ